MNNRYKVNLHILEACNYRCKHCFAHFDNTESLKVEDWKKVVDTCVDSGLVSGFNIAGGEPLLYRDLNELIDYINSKDVPVSIISNGFLMSDDWVDRIAPLLHTIGISIDSLIPSTLLSIGRSTVNQDYFSKKRFISFCDNASRYTKVKVNTVVTKLNFQEDMREILDLNVSRWKILKMQVFKNANFDNSELEPTDEEFDFFLNNNGLRHGEKNVVVERTLKNTYVFIDANGWLLDNSTDHYEKVSDVLTEPFSAGMSCLCLDNEGYFDRY